MTNDPAEESLADTAALRVILCGTPVSAYFFSASFLAELTVASSASPRFLTSLVDSSLVEELSVELVSFHSFVVEVLVSSVEA